MEFKYFAGEQRTPEWYALRLGKVTASRLTDWLAVSKAKGKEGTPLKARLDYEYELQYERQFHTSFERFVSAAMQEGIEFERFAIEQFTDQTGIPVYPVGAWYSDVFLASPDGGIGDPDKVARGEVEAIVEAKVLKDAAFMDVLLHGVPDKYMKQVQGQLKASGAKKGYFVAINRNTEKIKIIMVDADKDFNEYLDLSIDEKLTVGEFDGKNLFDFTKPAPIITASEETDDALADF